MFGAKLLKFVLFFMHRPYLVGVAVVVEMEESVLSVRRGSAELSGVGAADQSSKPKTKEVSLQSPTVMAR